MKTKFNEFLHNDIISHIKFLLNEFLREDDKLSETQFKRQITILYNKYFKSKPTFDGSSFTKQFSVNEINEILDSIETKNTEEENAINIIKNHIEKIYEN